MAEQKGFAIRRPSPAAESESRELVDCEGDMVDQLTPSSNTPGDSNPLVSWLREVTALAQGRTIASLSPPPVRRPHNRPEGLFAGPGVPLW